jgi:hypothetical protein
MPPRRKGWIAWRASTPRRILLDDLESGMLSLDSEEMSAEEAWNTYYLQTWLDNVEKQYSETNPHRGYSHEYASPRHD